MKNPTSKKPSNRGLPPHHSCCGMAVLCLTLPITPALLAQSVLTSPSPPPAIPAAVQEVQNSNPMQVFGPSPSAPGVPLQWGPVNFHPHLDYQLTYGNGIQSTPGQSQNTLVNQVAPGVLANLGDHWTLDYTPTLVFYSSSSFKDVVNQSVQLGWGSSYGDDWFFNGSQSYAYTSNPEVQTGAQTDQSVYVTELKASYQFSSKMSLDLGLNQDFNYFGNGSGSTNSLQAVGNSKSWSTLEWLNYQFWPRLNAGLGLGFGYNQQDSSSDSVYEQFQGRINWRATDKLSFQLSGGLHDQQYLTGGASNLLSPIVDATIQYQPFEQTRLSLNANSSVTTSAYQNQTTEIDSVGGNLNQRLLGFLHLDLSGLYSITKYVSSETGLDSNRKDNLYSFDARLSCPFLKRATIAIFYKYSDNSSSQSGFLTAGSGYGYTSNEVGLELGYRY